MKNILLLTDFSENAYHTGSYALNFGEKIKANVSLCNAFQEPVIVPEMSGGVAFLADEYTLIRNNSLFQLNQLKKRLERKAENSNQNSDFHPAISIVSSPGNLSDVIKEVILQESNELIIAGTRDKAGMREILFDNDVKNLIQNINFPLLLIPPKTVFCAIKKIGFAIELHSEAHDVAALRKLVRFAKPLDANILLIHIYSGEREKFTAEKHLKRILKIVANMEDCHHVKAKLLEEKNIEAGLQEVCKSEEIDLLSMVHNHHGFLSRVFSSSHTSNISDHIHIPLLVLPHEPERVK